MNPVVVPNSDPGGRELREGLKNNNMLYVSVSAVDGKATVHGISGDRSTLDGDGHIFTIDPAKMDAKEGAGQMVEWLAEHDVVGADLVAARNAIADAICDFLKGGMAGEGRASLYKPPITVACPCCGEKADLGLKECMKPGGRGCCPWVICGVCRYSGPEGAGAREAIELWNSGEVDPLVLLLAKIGRKHESVDTNHVRIIIMTSLLDNSPVGMDKVVEFCRRHPDLHEDMIDFLKEVGKKSITLMEKISI